MLEGGALSKPDFKAWSEDYVLFCHITSQVESDPHQGLLSKKGGRGFPHVVFMGDDGGVLAMHQDARDVGGFSRTADQARGLVKKLKDLRDLASSGDADAGKELFLTRFDLGHFSVSDALAKLEKLTLTADEKKRVSDKLTGMEIDEIMAPVTENVETHVVAGKKFYAMMKAGRLPNSMDTAQPFYILMMSYAESEKDSVLFAKALEGLKGFFAEMLEDPGVKAFFENKEKTLEEMRLVKQD